MNDTDGAILEAPGGGTLLRLKVVPGASRSQVTGFHGDCLKVRVAAPPEAGKANRAVLALLSAPLDVPKRSLQIVQGETSPRKTVRIEGIAPQVLRARLPR